MKPSAPFPTATQPRPGLHRSWRGLSARKPNRLQTGGRCGVNHSATAIQKWDRQEHGKACGLKAPGTSNKAMNLTWDDWNRFVKTENANHSSLIASYEYDGLWRRTVKTTTWEKRHYYQNDQWRSIEEHIEVTGGKRHLEQQHLWGAHHRWQYHRRDRDTTTTDGTSSLNEMLYALKDAMSITSIINTSGAVVERYHYSAFGQRLVTAPDGTVRADSTVDWKLGFHVEFADVNATGKVDSGLTNYGFRYYDLLCGKWIKRDPIGESEISNSLYSIASNNCIVIMDILGLYVGDKELMIAKYRAVVARKPSTSLTGRGLGSSVGSVGNIALNYEMQILRIVSEDPTSSLSGFLMENVTNWVLKGPKDAFSMPNYKPAGLPTKLDTASQEWVDEEVDPTLRRGINK